ncbi:MAG: tRNA isopentenyl-2-thiomethyl-A-37 hydroxylase MiaE, partial [Halieaceae bacterium]|nr:tRNA isopentenyl-2-thiomethyl-A-37 hydroxylase MiaE [Halieaceae bacterium]
YVEQHTLLQKMSRLAREELRHFEQVTKMMKKRGVDYVPISASRYAAGLHELVRKKDPGRLVDTLIIGALIEARSCERFAALAPHLDEELAKFYSSLLKSEARHFEDYLRLAESIADASEVAERLAVLRAREAELVTTPDAEFRFHSGVPVAA